MSELQETIPSDWNATLLKFNNAHILQTAEWAKLKSQVGWRPLYFSYPKGGKVPQAISLLLERRLNLGGFGTMGRILYAPKGPILDWQVDDLRAQVLDNLVQVAKHEKAIFLKIDPDIIVGEGLPGTDQAIAPPGSTRVISELRQRGWIPSAEQVQFRNTIQIDLAAEEDTLLARMKQKTRYNVRLATRKGITVRLGSKEDLDTLYHCYAETCLRDGFVIRERNYYIRTWETFLDAKLADVLLAEYEGEIVAGLFLFRFGKKAYYMYGMSRNAHREKMPSYVLQWEAMRRAKEMGCKIYDLWGAPEQFDESDPLWGVYRFKEGLGGKVIRTTGAWDYPVNPLLYRLYTYIMPKVLEIMRWRSRQETRSLIGE